MCSMRSSSWKSWRRSAPLRWRSLGNITLACTTSLRIRRPASTCVTRHDVIRLPSGRKLGYHSCGPADGTPVVYIHGHPDSGITITSSIEARVAQDLNIKWIGPDRLGVGESSAYDGQEVMDYPSDISSLISHLQVPEYHLLGTSGGTGFTLACAKDLKHLHPAL